MLLLAGHTGWSEAEILALPEWRFYAYLDELVKLKGGE
uniref:Phage protein n=1 Tax=Siphoviridae sp. ctLeG9 TaxID=2827848 RepID=A0A8S5RUP2_9CAUD|nr:MAG TPA: hypothetical protein [Siphoviridae sp. ctLeG9]